MPGSGKSTIGKAVARQLDLPFVDCDLSIERRAGCSIAAFFERKGEDAFRDLETETIASLVMSGRSFSQHAASSSSMRSARAHIASS